MVFHQVFLKPDGFRLTTTGEPATGMLPNRWLDTEPLGALPEH